jgi:hypothetical protein
VSQDVGIIVTGAVALGVPVIAALWARSNQAKALQHDREVRDLAELRNLLDEAADLLAESASSALSVVAIRKWDELLETTEGGHLTDAATGRQRELHFARQQLGMRSTAMQDRIAMRLGRDASVTVLHRAALAVLRNLGDTDPFADRERWKSLGAGLVNAREVFVDEANKLIASHLPSER